MSEQTKYCPKCDTEKPVGEFHKYKKMKDGLQKNCKACVSIYQREYYLRHGPAVAARVRARRAARPEHHRELDRRKTLRTKPRRLANYAAYREAHPVEQKARQAFSVARHQGVITPEPCELCGSMDGVCGHHEDYSKPYDVTWLCRRHHLRLHHNHFCLVPRPF